MKAKTTDFASHLTDYLSVHLPGRVNASPNTVASYRDMFRLFLLFCREERGIPPERLEMRHIDDDLVNAFLEWTEKSRGCGVSTRNQRLAALHAFVRYVQTETPERLLIHQRILAIPLKKTGKPLVPHLTSEALEAVLRLPDGATPTGRRDLTLLVVLYDTGARVQELVDLRVRDVRLVEPPTATLTGKGRKVRCVPLMRRTVELLKTYLEEKRLTGAEKADHPLFFNSRREALTRAGVAYVVSKYAKKVEKEGKIPLPPKVTPHVFRHTKAVHLLQANVNLIYIRDFLGHASVTTSEIYARADNRMKREALERAYAPSLPNDEPHWAEDENLLSWLRELCR
ncbi:MAG: site-specific integrase [Synergistaceae bacterium]|nr:site-specific integrase [Synergistaceae bacterium]